MTSLRLVKRPLGRPLGLGRLGESRRIRHIALPKWSDRCSVSSQIATTRKQLKHSRPSVRLSVMFVGKSPTILKDSCVSAEASRPATLHEEHELRLLRFV